jgi:hypothetical protein
MTVKYESRSGKVTIKVKYYDGDDDYSLPDVVNTTNWTDIHSGSSNPGWKRQISLGQNASTPYTVDTQKFNNLSIDAFATLTRQDGSRISIEHRTSGLLGPEAYDPADGGNDFADTTARQQFVKHYRSRRTQFQSGVFLGELRETVEMIRNPAKALRNRLDSYYGDVKKRLRKSKDRKRTIRDTWLEYNFGWAPLVNDVADAVKLATADPFRVFEKITGKGSSRNRCEVEPGDEGYSALRYNFNVKRQIEEQVSYKGAIRAENSPPSFPEQLGLSWSNVLPTAWELIPYSFLVDYFTNVGDIIDGISTGTISLAWGCRTQRLTSTTEIGGVRLNDEFLQSFTTYTGWTASGAASGGGLCSTRFRLYRQPIDSVSVGIGDFRFELPGTRSKKWLNIAALARMRQ